MVIELLVVILKILLFDRLEIRTDDSRARRMV